MNKIKLSFVIFCVVFTILIAIKLLFYRIVPFCEQYVFTNELDLSDRYGKNTWALITGPSSGMGRQFAMGLAERGFNLYLIGSKRTQKTIKEINKLYPSSLIKFTEVNFARSFEPDFFIPIEKELKDLDWSILINNVGHRVGAKVYEDMSTEDMKSTIAVGTLVQSKLIQYAIKAFKGRKHFSSVVNITAQCTLNTDLFNVSNEISVPHLACYEASNSFGFFHAKSVYAEIKNKYPKIDFLIITPGAVKTENTEPVLKDTIFAVDVENFVNHIFKLMGNYNGVKCASIGHSFSSVLINLFPFIDREPILSKIGGDFATKTKLKKY